MCVAFTSGRTCGGSVRPCNGRKAFCVKLLTVTKNRTTDRCVAVERYKHVRAKRAGAECFRPSAVCCSLCGLGGNQAPGDFFVLSTVRGSHLIEGGGGSGKRGGPRRDRRVYMRRTLCCCSEYPACNSPLWGCSQVCGGRLWGAYPRVSYPIPTYFRLNGKPCGGIAGGTLWRLPYSLAVW